MPLGYLDKRRNFSFHFYDKREIPIGGAPAEKLELEEDALSGALSIGRFVVSRWRLRRTRTYGYSMEGLRFIRAGRSGDWAGMTIEALTGAGILGRMRSSEKEKSA